ncbi:hypothetical protein LCGC14_0395160 [marine sediment metagenome]|uniref:Uncharacterized protein n=1 Tax=marine sediment metagenome TaxID=412755 RepID=A0A0F9VKC0_9ZZZZ
MTKTIRTVEIKKAAEEMYGKQMLEQKQLLSSLGEEVGRLRGRVEKLEGLQTLAKPNLKGIEV